MRTLSMIVVLLLTSISYAQSPAQLAAKADAESDLTGTNSAAAAAYNKWEYADCEKTNAQNQKTAAVAAMGNPGLIALGDSDYDRAQNWMTQGDTNWALGQAKYGAAQQAYNDGMAKWNVGDFAGAVEEWAVIDGLCSDAGGYYAGSGTAYDSAQFWYIQATDWYYSSYN